MLCIFSIKQRFQFQNKNCLHVVCYITHIVSMWSRSTKISIKHLFVLRPAHYYCDYYNVNGKHLFCRCSICVNCISITVVCHFSLGYYEGVQFPSSNLVICVEVFRKIYIRSSKIIYYTTSSTLYYIDFMWVSFLCELKNE